DDLAGQDDRTIGETPARLVGIVHGAIDAVAEAELAREMDRQPAGRIAVLALLDRRDESAVIALRERSGDFVLEVESFAENQGRQGTNERPTSAASGRRSVAARRPRAHRSRSRAD